ncbi:MULTISPECIES: DUF2380 domain-containing protein [unclassified Acidiphilium]|uniref:DUF2380 domain-containing protein n=1 Tax=unclassified Acidiphilium TaxID=2617493 RepID=UPI000BC7340B|nr:MULTISPECIES: DUF2380 domain-containing protein [unclassified Acidiphilium]OYV55674.1 MAG: hypothetical protein B7Z76_09470 [Acidiphilium sp. 20-67-58]OYV83229.1 MAG: hypothetical protein B7Z64_08755 [Acidiphilium sp. 21-68-69]HQT61446.1 DUF2380 domain-containing protein [Acidiphilium sp.]
MRGGLALAACALALIASGAGSAHAATQRPTVFVAPFDLFDTAADQRPAIVADQQRWLRHAAARIRADLDRAGRAKAVGTGETLARMKRIDADYDHPSTCTSCLVAAARQAGAGFLFVGTLHRVSDLIVYMKAYLLDVRSGRELMARTFEVKSDDQLMLDRAADRMAAALETRLKH